MNLEAQGLASIRVLRWAAGASPIERAFTLLDVDDDDEDPSVAHLEVPGGARYLESEQELRYRAIHVACPSVLWRHPAST